VPKNGENPSGRVTDRYFNGIGASVEGTVTCLAVSGNEAAVGFQVTQSSDPSRLGEGLVLYIQDNGNGATDDYFANSGWLSADQATTGSAYCVPQSLQPVSNSDAIRRGTFKVQDSDINEPLFPP
jgi:hypothetical protein